MPRRISNLAAFALAGLAILPASAQQNAPDYVRALAAGYKAAFVCSNLFNAGITPDQTAEDDLQGTYGELNPILLTLTADVDRENRRVTVTYAEAMPPRIAAWRPHLGCALLPIGAGVEDAAGLPRLAQPALDLAALDARPWPMGDRNAEARPTGDARALAAAVDRAFDRRSYGQGSETTAVVIVQRGHIVAERYRADFDRHMSQRTWSVAKSIAATVIGAAAQQGLLDVNAPSGVPEWQRPGDPRRRITTDNLLRMASGLHSDYPGNRTDALYFGGIGVAEEAASWPLVVPPDTRFRYSNNDTVLAIRALQHRLGDGEDSRLFPFRTLLWRIGMTRTVPETDWQGHFILSSQVWTTARDLARMGLLHLQDGVWAGERILPEGWTGYISRRGPAQPGGSDGYGAGWWVPTGEGIPAGTYAAQGNRGQWVIVVPSHDLVIVRRGFDRTGMAFDDNDFAREVIAALAPAR